jgi:hypothetical protein
MVWSNHFTQALLKTPAEIDNRTQQNRRIALLIAGVTAVLVGVPTGVWPLTAAGATAVSVAVLWHGIQLWRRLRRALPGRFRVTVRYYLAAAACVPVGATLGAWLARGLDDERHGQVLVAHSMVMVLGWIGLTVTGTLVTLWPTMLRTRMDARAESLARQALPVLVTAIAVVAMVIDRVLRPSIAIIKINYAATVDTWIGSFVHAIEIGDWPFPATVLMAVLMAGRALYLLLARGRALSTWNIVEICLGGAQLSALLLPVVSGTLIHIESLRYALAGFLLPIVWGLGWACRPGIAARWAIALPAAIAVVVTIAVAPAGLDAANRAGTGKPLLACLEANGLTTGLSDYWNAKLGMFQSNYRLHLLQLNESTALPWAPNFNVRWFSRRATGNAPARPDFIVLTGLPEAVVRNLYGAPQSVLECGGETVWRYDHTLALPAIEGV